MNKTNMATKSRLLLCALLLSGQSTLFSGPTHSNEQTRGPLAVGGSMLLTTAAAVYYAYQKYYTPPVLQNSFSQEEDVAMKNQITDQNVLSLIDGINELLTYEGTTSIMDYTGLIRNTYNTIIYSMDNKPYSSSVLYYLAKKIDDLLAHGKYCVSQDPSLHLGYLYTFFDIVSKNNKAFKSLYTQFLTCPDETDGMSEIIERNDIDTHIMTGFNKCHRLIYDSVKANFNPHSF